MSEGKPPRRRKRERIPTESDSHGSTTSKGNAQQVTPDQIALFFSEQLRYRELITMQRPIIIPPLPPSPIPLLFEFARAIPSRQCMEYETGYLGRLKPSQIRVQFQSEAFCSCLFLSGTIAMSLNPPSESVKLGSIQGTLAGQIRTDLRGFPFSDFVLFLEATGAFSNQRHFTLQCHVDFMIYDPASGMELKLQEDIFQSFTIYWKKSNCNLLPPLLPQL